MASVGVRELRQRASELLRLVQQGETIEVTDRGRPVALLTPVPEGSALERMRAAGEIEPVTYLDSSAIVKLAVAEPESQMLRRHLRRRRPLVSSGLARTEVLRALLPAG